MNILMVSPELPYPPHPGGGDRLRLYYLLKYLCRKHTITLLSPVGKKEAPSRVQLEQFGINIHAFDEPSSRFLLLRLLPGLFSTKPLAFATPVMKVLRKELHTVLGNRNFDLIYLHSWRSGALLNDVVGSPCVLSPADATSSLFGELSRKSPSPVDRLHFIIETPRVRAHEANEYKKATKCIVVSPGDKEILLRNRSGIDITVVPNGVDTDYFKPTSVSSGKLSVILAGGMSWHPNVDAVLYFYHEILPIVKKSVPELEFYVVGINPVKAVRDLAADKSVVVTGFVPDIRPYLSQSAVVVCPLRISFGIKNKVLEAMAMGKPVVGTPPSYDGIDVSYGRDAVVASNPAEFAAKLVELLEDGRMRAEIGQNAREFVEKKYSWERRALEYEQVFIQAAGGNITSE
jgi:sugar transferase (PEP-CTERM/EpsH1 system associated)